MISSLNGRIQEIDEDSLTVELGGIGLQVHVPAPYLERLHAGQVVLFYTHLIVREDAFILYGFETKDERSIFRLLLTVNGVGPRLALAVLSVLSPDQVRMAINQNQIEMLGRVPGIGKKTAQKIVLQLQDLIPGDRLAYEALSGIAEADSEVLAALTSLGYSLVEAQAAIQSIPKDTTEDVETRLRMALAYFQ